jgi:hypothetical protein
MAPRTDCRLSRQGLLLGVGQLVRGCGAAYFCILSPSLLSITISSESANCVIRSLSRLLYATTYSDEYSALANTIRKLRLNRCQRSYFLVDDRSFSPAHRRANSTGTGSPLGRTIYAHSRQVALVAVYKLCLLARQPYARCWEHVFLVSVRQQCQ